MGYIINTGSVEDIKYHLQHNFKHYSAEDFLYEMEIEKRNKNRKTVIRLLNSARKKKLKI
ncbi:MAG: hypothetical protein PHS33_07920 [Candidatus Omnitrophica bacterium]|nr:hypothetical protein [Candidatus Omnitrophota bacterium]